jgi:hypothetical protein
MSLAPLARWHSYFFSGTGRDSLIISNDHLVSERHDRYFLLDEVFDIGQRENIVLAREAYSSPSGAGATGPPDAMDIILWVLGEVVVDNMRHSLDV